MTRHTLFVKLPVLLASAVLAVGLVACSSDDPTQPTQTPTPGNPQPSAVWNITVTASKSELQVNEAQASIITIDVRRASDGSRPPNGSTVAVTANLGSFSGDPSQIVRSGSAQLTSGQAQIFFYASTEPGTALIRAQLENSFGQTNVAINDIAAFFLQAVNPNVGNPNGGEVVAIIGGGFVEPVTATIGGAAAQVLSVTPTRIRVRVPPTSQAAGTTQTVAVTVTNAIGTLQEETKTLDGAFTYSFGGSAREPRAFSFSPAGGPNEGGTTVTIVGENFEAPVQVLFGRGLSANTFNGVEATVQSVSPTQIVVTTPAADAFGQNLLNSAADILIRNTGTGLSTIATGAFTYSERVVVTAVTPASGPAEGGQTVTITGQGFRDPLEVKMGNVIDPQPIVSVSPTEIVVTSLPVETNSCANATGPVIVTLLGTGNVNATGPNYVYDVDAPTISSLAPISGTESGGTTVTISGTGFFGTTEVFFGSGRPGNVTSVTPTSVTVRTPNLPASDLQTQSCDDNFDGFQGERFVPTEVDLELVQTATTCSVTFTKAFSYIPNDQTCRNDTAPSTPPVAAFTFLVNGMDVAFDDASTGAPTSWFWNFGDGSSGSTLQNPTHTYAASGTYLVRLTVSNLAGSDTLTQSVTIP